MRYTGPKNRIARKFGCNIFGRNRNPLIHKPNPPGVHGAKRRKKSDFGFQLEEKQKLRAAYGLLTNKQLIITYQKASKSAGNTSHNFLQRLECRLDNIVYRLKFAPTIFAAQQLVAHGHVLVNGKKVDIRSFNVKQGMVISIKEKAKKMIIVKEAQESAREMPEYLTLESDKSTGSLGSIPLFDQIPLPLVVDVALVCEFLAHTT
ncbi:MAG: 30S ribosomal protein S4 [Candidatus Anoxychlamydiales bacterium]|nr:30S ribosomal protein S4 [Candidatus Anoxychlamydiales bacterium]NGX35572.1 30S ribosomal protein S4 [Candidatus Anoxychlamydiales bacterium]